ncbi:MAG TPA: PA2778 family cysteine peptidase [Burkholderiales bacterium]
MVVLAALSARARARNARFLAGVFFACAAAALGGCASFVPQSAKLHDEGMPAGLPKHVELAEVPFFPQDEYQCGPAALATVLASYGVSVTPEQLVPEVYIPDRKGSLQVEMLAAARRHGLVSYQIRPSLEALMREVAGGNPVIILQNLGIRSAWHYAVAIGWNYDDGVLILRSGEDRRKEMRFPMNELVWMRSGYWAMVAVPPERIPVTAEEDRWLAALAAYERVAEPRRARIAYERFLERWPGSTGASIGLANTLHAMGELKEAEGVLREAARLAPDSPVVLNNLAQTLADQGRAEEALPIIERAVAAGGQFADAIKETRQEILKKISLKKKAN